MALSALADGEAAADLQERCLTLWAEQAAARERWCQYQLIGDVLRSRELAHSAPHDAAFLSALRARLAREPAVLRPRGPTLMERLRTWATPMVATAGVAAVAGLVVVLRTAPTSDDAVQVAAQPVVATPAGAQMVVAPAAALPLQQVNGRLIRDARLSRYFAAHRQSATGTSLQMPGGVVRTVDTIVLEDR
ncbi:MAG TPA: sigma-E factor negative regulatory protein [Burkholderiaceae bacterium]|nr:sigma-E factor negative regulatory protein [Burkholderiaceae bacterium]